MKKQNQLLPLCVIALLMVTGAWAQDDELAKASQNPVADLISVPFQNNTSFGLGDADRTQNLMNIQPVIPVSMGKWNLINRTIVPILSQPSFLSPDERTFGFGDINHTTFLSPADAGKVIWGVGPSITLRTATDRTLGTGKWSAGPSFVALSMPGKWVIGSLLSNQWSFAGDTDRQSVNAFLWQYFVNYNFQQGWYFTSSPVVTANWKAADSQKWTVPFGAGFGRVFPIGKQPVNAQVQAFGYPVKPDGGPDWTLRFSLTFLFPKGG